ncbi:hypothetical protein DZF79_28635 [Vibrio parahaemolyticus]|nr:hypothetical protein [Vibrio parahaemolyticus]
MSTGFLDAILNALNNLSISNRVFTFSHDHLVFEIQGSSANIKISVVSPYFTSKPAHIWASCLDPENIEFDHRGQSYQEDLTEAEMAAAISQKAKAMLLFAELIGEFVEDESNKLIFKYAMDNLQKEEKIQRDMNKQQGEIKRNEKHLEMLNNGFITASRANARTIVNSLTKEAKRLRDNLTFTVTNLDRNGEIDTSTFRIEGEGKKVKIYYTQSGGYEEFTTTKFLEEAIIDSYIKI